MNADYDMNNSNERPSIAFAAIRPWLQDNIVEPVETRARGQRWVQWGDRNLYPDYIYTLYQECATLRSVIRGLADYVCGDGVDLRGVQAVNAKGDTPDELVRRLALDYGIYGGFALQVIPRRDSAGAAEVYAISPRMLRTDPDNEAFWYSEEWTRTWTRAKTLVYPKFIGEYGEPSILYVKADDMTVYPTPLYAASVKACEIERSIDDYHMNALANGFTASMMVNFNNGRPTSEIMEEIERTFTEKFSGHENAGRVVFCWNDGKDNAATIERLDTEDFGAKYSSLASRARQQIFTAFRANPNLFGIPTENIGFSQEEYDSTFRLFNRTIVRPAQTLISGALAKVYGEGALAIRPFSMGTADGDSAPADGNDTVTE